MCALMKNAVVEGTDGYEAARPEGSGSNDFGFGPRGNGSSGQPASSTSITFEPLKSTGLWIRSVLFTGYCPGSTTTTAPPKDAATASASAMFRTKSAAAVPAGFPRRHRRE